MEYREHVPVSRLSSDCLRRRKKNFRYDVLTVHHNHTSVPNSPLQLPNVELPIERNNSVCPFSPSQLPAHHQPTRSASGLSHAWYGLVSCRLSASYQNPYQSTDPHCARPLPMPSSSRKHDAVLIQLMHLLMPPL